ncbi:hypothetical protein OIU84_028283 [Salix udensis]|uniref:Uncharacterized protein n=1 Tax=Salix udensis TaxID=889485 RepID=A0AAD6KCQ3_9ROSI|nr:hypothetical protein OIU84_028283 [Salix udensis]
MFPSSSLTRKPLSAASDLELSASPYPSIFTIKDPRESRYVSLNLIRSEIFNYLHAFNYRCLFLLDLSRI